MRVLPVQPVHARLHRRDDFVVAALDDRWIVRGCRAVRRPVESRQELNDHLRRQREREQRGQAERRPDQHREHIDPDAGETHHPRERLAARGDHDGMVGAVTDRRHDRHAGAQREADEAAVGAEVDPVAVGPGAARVVVPAGEDQDR